MTCPGCGNPMAVPVAGSERVSPDHSLTNSQQPLVISSLSPQSEQTKKSTPPPLPQAIQPARPNKSNPTNPIAPLELWHRLGNRAKLAIVLSAASVLLLFILLSIARREGGRESQASNAPAAQPSTQPDDEAASARKRLIGEWKLAEGRSRGASIRFRTDDKAVLTPASSGGSTSLASFRVEKVLNDTMLTLEPTTARVLGDYPTYSVEFFGDDELLLSQTASRGNGDFSELAGRFKRVSDRSSVQQADSRTRRQPLQDKSRAGGTVESPATERSDAEEKDFPNRLIGKWEVAEGQSKGATILFRTNKKAVLTKIRAGNGTATYLATFRVSKLIDNVHLTLEPTDAEVIGDYPGFAMEFLTNDELLLSATWDKGKGEFSTLAGRLKRLKE